MSSAPDEINSWAIFWSVPRNEHFPAELQGQPILIIAGVYSGAVDEGLEKMQPLREIATPLLDLSGPMPCTMRQTSFDPFFPAGQLIYWKSMISRI